MASAPDFAPLPLVRGDGLEWAGHTSGVTDAMCDQVLNYYDRINVRDTIKSAMADRFAVKIQRDENDLGVVVEKLERGSIRDAINEGLYEVVQLGLMDRIVRTTATMHTEGETWQYVMGDGETEAEDVAELVATIRRRGEAIRGMVRADRLSVALGSSVLHLRYMGNHVSYEPIPCHSVRVGFPTFVTEGDTRRPADPASIRDAKAVVIKLSTMAEAGLEVTSEETNAAVGGVGGKGAFLAYCGASTDYPDGRLMQFTADDTDDLPGARVKGVLDWTPADGWVDAADTDAMANPLTLAQRELDDYSIPEYPIAVYLGCDARYYRELLPRTGHDLFETSKEFDMAASSLAMCANTAARGVYALKNPKGSPRLMDTWDRGIVELTEAQELEVNSVGGGNVESGWRVIQEQMRTVAEEYDVPGWMVTADNSGAPQSGYSIALQTEPLKRSREERAKINASAVDAIYQIERGLLAVHADYTIPGDITQIWNPGAYKVPVNGAEQVTELKGAMDAGLEDMVGAVMQRHGFETREEAREYLEQRKADEEAFPSKGGDAQQGPAQGGGIAGLLAQRQQARQQPPAPPPAEDEDEEATE